MVFGLAPSVFLLILKGLVHVCNCLFQTGICLCLDAAAAISADSRRVYKPGQFCSWSTQSPNEEFYLPPHLPSSLGYGKNKVRWHESLNHRRKLQEGCSYKVGYMPRPYLAKESVPFEIPAGTYLQILSWQKFISSNSPRMEKKISSLPNFFNIKFYIGTEFPPWQVWLSG